MVRWNNLLAWLSGRPRDAEHSATRARWNDVETAWRGSPAAGAKAVDLSYGVVREALAGEDRAPAESVLMALLDCIETLILDEAAGPAEADWPAIESDAQIAVRFRAYLARRERWALDYDRQSHALTGQLVLLTRSILAALPEAAYGEWETDEGAFTVPLVELLDNPAAVIGELLWSCYEPATLERELLLPLRERLVTNLLIASGLPAETNPRLVKDKLVGPTEKRGLSAGELAKLYLAGTPLLELLSLPVPLPLPDELRFEHCHVIGGTGHGKTQLLQRMILADLEEAIEGGRSVVVIDSQGDLIEKLLNLDVFSYRHPGNLVDRLVLIDPADVEHPAALNLFDAHLSRLSEYSAVDQERVLNGVVELYETFFGAMLGAELTQKQGVIFRYLARLMVSIPGANIRTLMELMEDGRAYKPQMAALTGSARHFFETEFWSPSFSATKSQILKRLWGVLATPAFERMFMQPENKLDLFSLLQEGRIVLVSTAKDVLKTEGSALFGRFILALLSQAALERSTLRPEERTPTFVYVDEAQEYFDDSIETILTQARKYRVGLTIAHQTLDQLTPRLRSAILANTSVKLAGGVSAKDARALAYEMHTDADFLGSMRRRGMRTEFAVWLKNRTPRAVRLSVPLGYLERQPTISETDHTVLIELSRAKYSGAGSAVTMPPPRPAAPSPEPPPPMPTPPAASVSRAARPLPPPEPGKGGKQHRYLQSLVKQLAEERGFRATIEAPLPEGGQVDVLLARDELTIAVEVSVSTPVEWERENLKKRLAAGAGQVLLVLAKPSEGIARYRAAVLAELSDEDRGRVRVLLPEELPEFIESLAPPPGPEESVVRGYRVKVTQSQVSPAEAKARRETLAKLVAKSMKRQD